MKTISSKFKATATVIAIAAALSTAAPVKAGGGGGFAGATEVTQLLNNAELLALYAEEVQQSMHQLQQLQNLVQNTQQLPIQMWQSVVTPITDMITAIENTQAVVRATSNAVNQMGERFGDSRTIMRAANEMHTWNRDLNNSIGAALRQAGINIQGVPSRQAALQAMQAASQSAQGRKQVLQAGNQIAGMVVNELQLMHGTIVAVEQARLNAIAVETNQDNESRLRVRKFLGEDITLDTPPAHVPGTTPQITRPTRLP